MHVFGFGAAVSRSAAGIGGRVEGEWLQELLVLSSDQFILVGT